MVETKDEDAQQLWRQYVRMEAGEVGRERGKVSSRMSPSRVARRRQKLRTKMKHQLTGKCRLTRNKHLCEQHFQSLLQRAPLPDRSPRPEAALPDTYQDLCIPMYDADLNYIYERTMLVETTYVGGCIRS